jgi:hypothetical protein
MGHTRYIGEVSQVEKFGTTWLQVNVPTSETEQEFTVLIQPQNSVYAIRLIDEQAMNALLDQYPPASLIYTWTIRNYLEDHPELRDAWEQREEDIENELPF